MIADKPPNGWTRVKFGDVVRNVNENSRDLEGDGIERVVGLDHLDPGSLRLVRWDDLADLPDGTTFTRKFKPGQVLFGKRRAYQRKVAVPDFEGVCSGDILVFEPADKRMLSEFLPYLVQSDGFFDHALGTSAGSLSPRTKWAELAKYEFALPPIDEQQRAVELLSALDSLAAGHEVLEASIAATRTAYFAGQWECGTEADLAQIGKVATGKTPPTGEKGCWEPPEVPFLAPGDFSEEVSLLSVTERHVSKSGSAVAGVIRPYSVVQVCIGWSSGKVGIVLRECSSNQQVNSLQGLDPIDATYVASSLASAEGRWRFARLVGTQNFPMVRKSDWSRIRIPWPDRASRESVAQRIHHLGELERSTQEDRLKVYALRRTLLERCLTGVDSRVH